jgi:hypothetical protein
MRTISARAFRDNFANYVEPVTVTKRNPQTGDIETLGCWTPAASSKVETPKAKR